MPEALPDFRYHPDPVASGAIERSETKCIVCGQNRGFIYAGPVYAEEEFYKEICPWCIADGRAHRELQAEFFDSAGVGGGGVWESVSDEVVAAIAERTPSFSGWQQERWFTCCGDAAAFVGRAGTRELQAHGPEAHEAIRREAGLDASAWSDYLDELDGEGSPTAYLFRSLHCGSFGGYSDCD